MNERVLQLAEGLVGNHVKATFGIPGSGLSWQLASALEKLDVPFFNVSHEAAGAVMAGAFGRQTKSLGCSLSIKGPGLVNMLPGILSNAYEQWSVVSISEAFGPGTPSFRMHKRLDHETITSPAVKAYATLGNPATVVSELAKCAWAEIPGPVHLDLFEEEAYSFHCQRPAFGTDPAASADWSQVQHLVNSSKRPVLIVGSLARRAEWANQLANLRVPVFTTLAAKGVIDENLPWSAGVFTGAGKALAPENRVMEQADLIIGLGLRNLEVLNTRAFRCPSVILDLAGPQSALGFGAAHSITDAASPYFEWVLSELQTKDWGQDVVVESLEVVRRHLTRSDWLPGRVFVELQAGLSAIGCLVVDTGSFCTVAEHVWLARSASAFLASANGRFMGTGLPMALGAALADPTRPVLCALGDGGMMYVAEIKLAIEQRLPVLFLLMSDGRYGSIASAMSAEGLNLKEITLSRPSWFKAIEALGCVAAQVTDLTQLMRYVRQWDWQRGPLFLELVFDAELYMKMTMEVR